MIYEIYLDIVSSFLNLYLNLRYVLIWLRKWSFRKLLQLWQIVSFTTSYVNILLNMGK